MKQMLERETWYNVPISVEDLGGMAGVIGNHTRALAWPAMNGWGCVMWRVVGCGAETCVRSRLTALRLVSYNRFTTAPS